jgi:hypothetical protein
MKINEIDSYSGDIQDIIIAIREVAKVEAKEIKMGYFNSKGEVSITVKR